MSKRTMVVGGLVLLLAVGAIGAAGRDQDPISASPVLTSSPTARSAVRPTARSTPQPSLTPVPTFGPVGETTEATVVRVTDGDTIVVAYGGTEYRVRYIGMDAPETIDPNSSVQLMGLQAAAANAALVEGKTVFLEKDVSDVDQFDRLLRYVWLTDGTAWTLVNLELVRQGVAAAKSYPPDSRYDAFYVAAEDEAHRSGLGIWGPTPAVPTPNP